MGVLIMKKTEGIPCRPDYNCIRFERAPYSLIEEPEVCEWCIHYDDDAGLCQNEENNA